MFIYIRFTLMIMVIILAFALSVCSVGSYFTWKSYTKLTHSKITYWDYFCLQPTYINTQQYKIK